MTAEVLSFPARRMRPDREPRLKKPEVAEYLRVSERWIELRMKRDGFPYHKDRHSRLVYFLLSEIDEWMEDRSA